MVLLVRVLSNSTGSAPLTGQRASWYDETGKLAGPPLMKRGCMYSQTRIAIICCAVVGLMGGQTGLGARSAQEKRAGPVSGAAEQQAVVGEYCYGCHNERTSSGRLVLTGLDITRASDNAEVWEKVILKLRAGMMPPRSVPRPDTEEYRRLISWLETEIDRGAAHRPTAGEKPALHRLNRVEYQNAIRDVLALAIDATEYLPTDATTGGFDNIATALRLSPTLIERYLSAAEKISRLAVGGVPPPTEAFYKLREELQFDRHVEGLAFGTRGGMLIRHTFPVDGEYDLFIEMYQAAAATNTGMITRNDARRQQLEVTIDGEVAKTAEVSSIAGRTGSTYGKQKVEGFRLPIKAGPHEVGVSFVVTPSAVGYTTTGRPPYERGTQAVSNITPLLIDIKSLKIAGPFNISPGPGDTPSRRRIFVCRPTAAAAQEAACAKTIMRNLARRAYRRPADDADMAVLQAAYERGRREGGFERGIEMAISQLLMSPKFFFRVEAGRSVSGANTAAPAAAQPYPISDLELASRLSFFLWSSVPDEELLEMADRGQLRDEALLERQVRRMLADDRSSALIENFVGQWLFLRNLPDEGRGGEHFPNFDETLREAFGTETRLFFQSILREDRSLLDILRADYTYVNGRLARHYGIPNVQGSHFRRVTFTDAKRRGILGQGTLLMVTSAANRTSPVLRGKWVMENVLGAPPPPPPPQVPPLKEQKVSTEKPKTMRARMAAHRANPVCASCHAVIDPLGFALENFDAVGKWREVDDGFVPIDASGTLPDGTAFSDIVEFRQALADQSENFLMTFTQKLMTYALGRVVDYRDMPVVRKIVRESASSNYRVSSLILGLVKSVPFQMRSSES